MADLMDQMIQWGTMIFIIGFMLSVGTLIMTEVRDDGLTTASANLTFTAAAQNAWASIQNKNIINSSVIVYNNTGNEIVAAPNYSIETASGSILFSVADYSLKPMNISYDYYESNAFWNATTDGANSTSELAGWLATIALILVATLIIGFVIIMFRRTGEGGI